MASKLNRLEILYYDEERSSDIVVCGQWECVLADRKYGEGAVERGNLEAVTYAAYKAAQKAGIVPAGQDFDAWGATVAQTDKADSGESPAPLET